MRERSLALYRQMSRMPWPRTYLGKIFFIAFVGTHIPLLGLLGYVAVAALPAEATLSILVAALLATVGGMLLTLGIQHGLMAPIIKTSEAMRAYMEEGVLPDLPRHYPDRAGRLMRDTQDLIRHLDRLMRLKNRLLGVVSHDVRTPLTTITMGTSILEEELAAQAPDVAAMQEIVAMIAQAAHFQKEMMDNLLGLARAEEPGFAINKTRTTVGEVLDQVRAHHELVAASKGIVFRVEANGAAALPLYTDRVKLEQVLGNLVSNALKFTPKGGTVELHATTTPDDLHLSVHDTGLGIPQEQQERLFEAFTQVHEVGTAAEKGTGLGLWISRLFTRLLGGNISVESTPGQGTTFSVALPRKAVERQE